MDYSPKRRRRLRRTAVWVLREVGMTVADIACVFSVSEKTVFNWSRTTSSWSDTEKLQVLRLNKVRGKIRRRDIRLAYAGDSKDAESYARRYKKGKSIIE